MTEDKNFSDWFYQTTDGEDKPVVGFDKLMSNHHSQAESWLKAAYRAGYKKAKGESTVESKGPFYIGVEEVKEHEDGSATYSFMMDDVAAKEITNLGLQFILYCGAAKVDMQDALDWIISQTKGDEE